MKKKTQVIIIILKKTFLEHVFCVTIKESEMFHIIVNLIRMHWKKKKEKLSSLSSDPKFWSGFKSFFFFFCLF